MKYNHLNDTVKRFNSEEFTLYMIFIYLMLIWSVQ